jgi:hypothetical protein
MLAGPPDKIIPSGLSALMVAMEMSGGSIWQ